MRDFLTTNRSTILFAFLFIAVSLGIITLLKLDSIGSEEIIINTGSKSVEEVGKDETSYLSVDVSGEVKNPGVYKMKEGSIINDLIDKAGGFTEDADKSYIDKNINKAAEIAEGQKIYIPGLEDKSYEDNEDLNASSNLININTASASQLDSLPGIGLSYAEKIISARPYSSIDEIKNVKGIGESTFSKIKDKISI